MSREKICRRVVGNLEDYKRELDGLREKEGGLIDDLAELQRELSGAMMRSVEGGGDVGRRPATGGRGGRGGSAFDIVSGVGGALLSDNSGEVRRIEEQAKRKKAELDDFQRRINSIRQNVRRQQS